MGQNNKPSTSCHCPLLLATGSYALALGQDTKPGHQGLVRPDSLSWCIFWAFIPWVWFPYSSFQQVRQPSIPSPVEEDTSKIRDTTGTVFIQGPSIVLLVWRSIMFNGSYLRACMKLRIVQKLDFAFLSLGGPSHGARVWCLGRVPKHRNHWQEVEGSGKK